MNDELPMWSPRDLGAALRELARRLEASGTIAVDEPSMEPNELGCWLDESATRLGFEIEPSGLRIGDLLVVKYPGTPFWGAFGPVLVMLALGLLSLKRAGARR